MTPKHSTQMRAWGSRYDTLGGTPPSPSAGPPTRSSPSPSPTHPQSNNTLITPISTSATKQHPDGTTNTTIKSDKVPHEASIFVGSLPSNMDHLELSRLLSEHLSEYPEVKSVKVVRDAKGGVCAFIQCEDASMAARLLETFQNHPPRALLGRYLRFEPARGFRTLLISYRTPLEFQMSKAVDDSREDRAVERPLHTAIRIFRSPGNKYISVIYDEEAVNFVPGPVYGNDVPVKDDIFSGAGALVAPLQYDAKTIREIAELFGPLEHFMVYNGIAENGEPNPAVRMYPHNAPRSSGMEEDIWEVKWRHRDDCVAAFSTLRKMPHITVTKAHRMAMKSNETERFGTPSPHFTPFSSPHRIRTFSHQFSPNPEYQRYGIMQTTLPRAYVGQPPSFPPRLAAEVGIPDGMSPTISTPEKWTFAHSTPFLRGPASPLAAISGRAVVTSDAQGQSPQWSETDFPPLQGFPGLIDHAPRWAEAHEVQGVNEESEKDPSTSPSPSSSLSVQPSTPVPPRELDAIPENDEEGQITSPHTHIQELTIPNTPEFSVSSVTPRTGMSMSFPRTPQSAHRLVHDHIHVDQSFSTKPAEYDTPRRTGRFSVDMDGDHAGAVGIERKEYDPLTIFVGGLEMFGPHAWDEEKLREVFEKHGEIEDIQLVKPSSKKSAFSFVKFKSPEASSRAVAAEHNRVYDGRQIRVQFRDTNPQRSPWRAGRGRGRVHHHFAPPPRLHPGMSEDHYGANASATFARYNEYIADARERTTSHSSLSAQNLASVGSSETMVTAESSTVYGDSSEPKLPSMGSSSDSIRGSLQLDVQRAQSSNTNVSVSTTPSSMGYPTPAGPVPQYPIPPMGYFPQQWMPAYAHSYPYAFPFMPGYMGFAPPVPQGHSPAEGGWMTMNSGYKSISPYPTASGEQTQVQPHQQLFSQSGVQPPLRATGFIQGEHDTLIPVYQPEALNQYMSGTASDSSHSASSHQAPSGAVASGTLPSHQTPVWQPYPQMPMYPYMYQPPSHPGHGAINTAQLVPTVGGWMPASAALPYPMAPAQHQQTYAAAAPQVQLHATPPPYANIPSPGAALPAGPQGPAHRIHSSSPNAGYVPAQHPNGSQQFQMKRYPAARRDGFVGPAGVNGGGPGRNFNTNFNRPFSQSNGSLHRGAGVVRQSPEGQGSQGVAPVWRPTAQN